MEHVATAAKSAYTTVSGLIDQCEQLLDQHRAANPDLYRLVELKKGFRQNLVLIYGWKAK